MKECVHCNAEFKDNTNLKRHFNRMHTARKCIICEREYTKHEVGFKQYSNSKCCSDICRKKNTQSKVKGRRQYKTKYQCEICNLKFKESWALNRHRKDVDCSDYNCLECDKVMQYESTRGKRNHICGDECRKKRKNRLSAIEHRTNPTARISIRFANGIRDVISGRRKKSNVWAYLDYTPDDLIKRFEGLFTKGMSWDNMHLWHIDHIKPKASFNYTTTDCEDFKKCWALENLQPLWARDNLKKGSKEMEG